nr:MAG TPA: hypothetical protein [Caudoviricetes sp.]
MFYMKKCAVRKQRKRTTIAVVVLVSTDCVSR